MNKNDDVAGSPAQRQQDTFYLNDDTPRPIQYVFIHGKKCYVSVISSSSTGDSVWEVEVTRPSFVPRDERDNSIMDSFMDFLQYFEAEEIL
jgi:hypothetical protein